MTDRADLEDRLDDLEDRFGDDHELDTYGLTEEEEEHFEELFANVDRDEPEQWYKENGDLTPEANYYLDAAFDAEPDT